MSRTPVTLTPVTLTPVTLTPLSRETMRGLKAKKEEEERLRLEGLRIKHVNSIIKEIYTTAMKQAETTTDSSYSYKIPAHPPFSGRRDGSGQSLPDYHRLNMGEILEELRYLFPDCSVTHTNMCMGYDGRMYNLLLLDETLLPLLDTRKANEYIVLDWS